MSDQLTPKPFTHINQIRWACRRGMLELDVLLLPFFERHYEKLGIIEQQCFQKLLHCDDPDLFAWFMGYQPCEQPELSKMVAYVLQKLADDHR